MAASRRRLGAERLAGIAAILVLLMLSACALFSDDADQEMQEDAESSSGKAAMTEGDAEAADPLGLPHPEAPTAWATRVMMTTHELPSEQALETCVSETRLVAAEAESQQEMMNARHELAGTAGKDPRLFHFCFYRLVTELDQRMARGGPLFDDLADEFFKSMRTLWILGSALDEMRGRSRYFAYVQARYLQISREVFGRNLEVVGGPMRGVLEPGH